MQDDNKEAALRLYENTVELYTFSIKTIIQVMAGFLSGTGVVIWFWQSHPEFVQILWLPIIVGLSMSIGFAALARIMPNFHNWCGGYLNVLEGSYSCEGLYGFVPSHLPCTVLCIISSLICFVVSLLCITFGWTTWSIMFSSLLTH